MCLLNFILIPSGRLYSNPYPNDLSPEDEYHSALDAVNKRLTEVQDENLCPGVNLATSCGNGKCEPEQGKNEVTCPIDCVIAPVESYNFQTFCKEVKRLVVPGSVSEVQEIVRGAVAEGLHVRVIGESHTVNRQLCTDGVAVSTEKLNHILGIETFHGHETVVVEPGVLLGSLMDWLDFHGKTLGYPVMGYRGVSIGGAIGTGSHGSSPRHSDVLSDAVESIELVAADGSLREYDQYSTDPDIFNALRTNLGMLGAVVQIRLKIQPQFNLHVHVSYESDQNLLSGNILDTMSPCDFGLINWFPETGRVVRTCGNETSEKADSGAQNAILEPSIPQFLVKPYKVALQLGACFPDLNVLIEGLSYATLRFEPPFSKLNGLGNPMNSSDVIGPSHKMMSGDLTPDGKRSYNKDYEFAVPRSQLPFVLRDAQEVLLADRVSLPLRGIFIRFAQVQDQSLLSHVTSGGLFVEGESVALIEFPVYRPFAFSESLEDGYFAPYERLAHLILEKYQGRAHWGKNEEWIFDREREIGSYGNKLQRFIAVAHQIDPSGVFQNTFGERLGF